MGNGGDFLREADKLPEVFATASGLRQPEERQAPPTVVTVRLTQRSGTRILNYSKGSTHLTSFAGRPAGIPMPRRRPVHAIFFCNSCRGNIGIFHIRIYSFHI